MFPVASEQLFSIFHVFFFFLNKEIHVTPVLLPGEFHGQRSLAGYTQSRGSQRVRHDCVTNFHFFSYVTNSHR